PVPPGAGRDGPTLHGRDLDRDEERELVGLLRTPGRGGTAPRRAGAAARRGPGRDRALELRERRARIQGRRAFEGTERRTDGFLDHREDLGTVPEPDL